MRLSLAMIDNIRLRISEDEKRTLLAAAAKRGLIQFGEPQARQHGVDWNDPLGSQLGPDGAIANYFRSSGFQPGMSGLDLYSTINAGAPGRYSASDANNGGAPGSVRDKWENQMAGHRQKAAALLGSAGLPATATS